MMVNIEWGSFLLVAPLFIEQNHLHRTGLVSAFSDLQPPASLPRLVSLGFADVPQGVLVCMN